VLIDVHDIECDATVPLIGNLPSHLLKPHTDESSITFVLQDKEVEGLQVLKDNQWFKVPIIPDALVINVGDQLEVGTWYLSSLSSIV
jgi:isopenicillin N synthase-like dioxygenase